MRSVRLGRQFDAVLVHDAIDYVTSEANLRQVVETAFAHCRPGGLAVFVPDHTADTFHAVSGRGGSSDATGRQASFQEWTWDPDPADDWVRAEYEFSLRAADGTVQTVHETHRLGAFRHNTWLRLLTDARLRRRRPDQVPRPIRASPAESQTTCSSAAASETKSAWPTGPEKAPAWSGGLGGWAVTVQGPGAVGAGRGDGPVGVEHDLPAPAVDRDQVVERAQQIRLTRQVFPPFDRGRCGAAGRPRRAGRSRLMRSVGMMRSVSRAERPGAGRRPALPPSRASGQTGRTGTSPARALDWSDSLPSHGHPRHHAEHSAGRPAGSGRGRGAPGYRRVDRRGCADGAGGRRLHRVRDGQYYTFRISADDLLIFDQAVRLCALPSRDIAVHRLPPEVRPRLLLARQPLVANSRVARAGVLDLQHPHHPARGAGGAVRAGHSPDLGVHPPGVRRRAEGDRGRVPRFCGLRGELAARLGAGLPVS